MVLYSFPEKLLVKYDCIYCGNLLLNASYIIIHVCNLTSWNIVNIFRLRNNFEVLSLYFALLMMRIAFFCLVKIGRTFV